MCQRRFPTRSSRSPRKTGWPSSPSPGLGSYRFASISDSDKSGLFDDRSEPTYRPTTTCIPLLSTYSVCRSFFDFKCRTSFWGRRRNVNVVKMMSVKTIKMKSSFFLGNGMEHKLRPISWSLMFITKRYHRFLLFYFLSNSGFKVYYHSTCFVQISCSHQQYFTSNNKSAKDFFTWKYKEKEM